MHFQEEMVIFFLKNEALRSESVNIERNDGWLDLKKKKKSLNWYFLVNNKKLNHPANKQEHYIFLPIIFIFQFVYLKIKKNQQKI